MGSSPVERPPSAHSNHPLALVDLREAKDAQFGPEPRPTLQARVGAREGGDARLCLQVSGPHRHVAQHPRQPRSDCYPRGIEGTAPSRVDFAATAPCATIRACSCAFSCTFASPCRDLNWSVADACSRGFRVRQPLATMYSFALPRAASVMSTKGYDFPAALHSALTSSITWYAW